MRVYACVDTDVMTLKKKVEPRRNVRRGTLAMRRENSLKLERSECQDVCVMNLCEASEWCRQ